MRSLVIGVAFSLIIVPGTYAQSDPFQGTWRLNLARSRFEPLSRGETMVVDISSEVEHVSFEVVTADGAVQKSEYVAKQNDGKWYPMKSGGVSPPSGAPSASALSVMVVKLNDRNIVRFLKRGNDTPSLRLCTVSEDGRTFTWMVIDMGGKVGGVFVFEKQ